MAFSGCAYPRIHAATELAKRAHRQLVYGQGTCPSLNLAPAMPALHTTGSNWSQLLQEGLIITLDSPTRYWYTLHVQLQELHGLSIQSAEHMQIFTPEAVMPHYIQGV